MGLCDLSSFCINQSMADFILGRDHRDLADGGKRDHGVALHHPDKPVFGRNVHQSLLRSDQTKGKSAYFVKSMTGLMRVYTVLFLSLLHSYKSKSFLKKLIVY